MQSSRRIGGWHLCLIIGYVVLLSAVVGSMFWVRHTALTELSAPGRADAMRAAARASVAHLSPDAMATQLVSLYRTLLHDR